MPVWRGLVFFDTEIVFSGTEKSVAKNTGIFLMMEYFLKASWYFSALKLYFSVFTGIFHPETGIFQH